MVTPADIVARQVDAYNRGDVMGFVACYAEDIVIHDLLKDRVTAAGKEELTHLYRHVLNSTRGLHCEVVGRLLADRFVIDREIVTGLPGDRELHAVAVYEVEKGLIHRVWMIRESFPV